MGKINLKLLSISEIKEFIKELRLPLYRAEQILRWIYEKGAISIDEITNLSKTLRLRLGGLCYISSLRLIDKKTSGDGTEKFLFELNDGKSIEGVLIPEENRLTLCISTQVGCALGCKFCLTGRMGFKRNLKAFEIVDEVISVRRLTKRHITNVVFMGMGEPLMNLDETVEAIKRLTSFMHFSKRKITLSTAGVIDGIIRLGQTIPDINLAISLNAVTDKVRDFIMPINKKYPITKLLNTCRQYPLPKRRRITFEYVMLNGVNDTEEDARRLIALLKGTHCKVNLIPFNEYEGCEFRRPSDEKTLKFQDVLLDRGMTAFIRKSKGADIYAACGQLRGLS